MVSLANNAFVGELTTDRSERAGGVMNKFPYSLHLAGQPLPITLLVTYSSKAGGFAPTLEMLRQRVEALCKTYPILQAHLDPSTLGWVANQDNARGTAPNKELGIVHGMTYTPSEVEEGDHTLITAAYDRAEKLDPLTGPLVRVELITPRTPGAPGSANTYLALSVDHLLTDGMGAARLLALLVDGLGDEVCSETHLATPLMVEHLPLHKVEDLISFIPAVPPLESTETAFWPTGCTSPLDAPPGFFFSSFPAEWIDRLKVRAKENGVPTLEPLLETAYTVALWDVTGRTDQELMITTFKDYRSACGQQCPHWSGNIFAGISGSILPLSHGGPTVQPGDASPDFWHSARTRSATILDPIAQEQGRHALGARSYDPLDALVAMHTNKARSSRPYTASVSFSNLGSLALPQGAVDIEWISSALPFLAAVIVHFAGHAGGLKMSQAFRCGSPLKEQDVGLVADVFGRILQKLLGGARGSWQAMLDS